MYRKMLTMLFVLSLAMIALACSGGKKSPLLGKWEIVRAEGMMASANVGTVYEFRSNGKLIMSKGYRVTYTWSVQGNILKWQLNERFRFVAVWKNTGNTLVLDMKGNDQKFTLKRR